MAGTALQEVNKNREKRWYAVYAHPGFEHRVKAALTRKIGAQKMQDVFSDILVPTEKVIEFVSGVKRIVERRMFPGYLLVRVNLIDEVWHLIRSIPKVIGIVGRTVASQSGAERFRTVNAGRD